MFSCKSLNINIVSKYQAGIWTSCTQPHQVISNPSEFGQNLLLHGVENWSGLAYQKFFLSVPAKEITVDIIVPKLMYAAQHCVVANAAINIQLLSIYVLNLKLNMLTSYTIILA